MLTAPADVANRPGAIAAAVGPTARVAHLGSVLAVVAAGAVPALVSVARGGTVGVGASVAIGVAAGAAVGWAVEDPAADLLAAMPVSAPVRAALRTLLATAVVVGAVAALAVVVAVGPGLPPDLADRLPEVLATGALALAIGCIAVRRDTRGAGIAAVTGGGLGTLVLFVFAFRWPEVLPGVAAGPAHDRWWVVVACAGLVALRAGRDPGAP